MERTIEDSIKYLTDMKKACLGDYELLSCAIETMRKYQRIQDIINNTEHIQEDVIRYQMICEVIEFGRRKSNES